MDQFFQVGKKTKKKTAENSGDSKISQFFDSVFWGEVDKDILDQTEKIRPKIRMRISSCLQMIPLFQSQTSYHEGAF